MFPKNRTWIVAGLLLLSAGGGLAAWRVHLHHKYKHFAVHEPGMVYRSAWLDPDTLSDVIDQYQIRTIVNLCDQGELTPEHWESERRVAAAEGVRLVEIPMPLSVHVSDRHIGLHLEVLQDPDSYPLLVHCQHGVTRTAKLLTIYDIAFRNMTARDSLAAQPRFGRDEHNVHVRAFARNFETNHRRVYQALVPAKLDVLRD